MIYIFGVKHDTDNWVNALETTRGLASVIFVYENENGEKRENNKFVNEN